MKHSILVVEDNPLNRELLCDWLEAEGYQVCSAETLSSAMASMEQRAPGAVLLDVQLGHEDGRSRLVGQHQSDWINGLREALIKVDEVRSKGPLN